MQTSQNRQEVRIEDLKTLSDVVGVLATIGITDVPNAAIASVAKLEAQRFKEALIASVNSGDETQKIFVRRCLCLCTKPVVQALGGIGINPNFDIFVRKGIEKGKEIRTQLSIASDITHKEANVAREWLISEFTGKVQQLRPQQGMDSNVGNVTDDSVAISENDAVYTGNESVPESGRKDFRSLHYYGKDAALCFSASMTRGSKPAHTINIDASKSKGPKEYDWKNAVHFQFTPKELHGLHSVLINQNKSIDFKSHGGQNDKGFSFERQEGKFYSKLYSKEGGARALPIVFYDAVMLAILVIDQISLENPGYLKPDLLTLTRAVIGFRG